MTKSNLDVLVSNLHEVQKNGSDIEEIEALFKLANYHYNDKNFDKTKLFLNDILKIDKTTANVNYYLALILIEENKLDRAIKLLEKEIRNNTKNETAHNLIKKLTINANFPLITLFLLLINSFVFFFISYPQISFINSIKFGISSSSLYFYNALTSIFIHINVIHFVSNMCILLLFGIILEKYIGSMKFLLIYTVSGIIGNFAQALLFDSGIVIGASSALFGVLGAIMMREPLLKIRILGIFKIPIIIMLSIIFILSSFVNIFFENMFITGEIAHFVGFIVGLFFIAIFYIDTIDIFYNWLFISIGFLLIQYAIEEIIFIGQIATNLTLILVGILIITYSYVKLKEFKGINQIH